MSTENNTKILMDEIERCSKDASIFKVNPVDVIVAKDFDIVSEYVKKEKPFSVRAAGTCMSGGSLTDTTVIDISKMENYLDVNKIDNNLLWVKSNTYIKDLLFNLSEMDKFFAPYTSSKDICTLGGMLGNNASGEKSLSYGPTNKNVSELKIILNTKELKGELYHSKEKEIKNNEGIDIYDYNFEKEIVELIKNNIEIINHNRPNTNKNASGYNLWDVYNPEKNTFNLTSLFIGAQGTLGIITEAKIKVENILKFSKMLIIPIENLHDLPKIVKECTLNKVTSIECFDHETYELAKIHMASDANLARLSNNKKMIIFSEFCGDDENDLLTKIKTLKNKLHDMNTLSYISENEEESIAYWNIRRASFKLLRDFAPLGYKAIPIIEDTIISLEHYDNYLKDLLSILNRYDMRYTYAGHIGDGSIRLIPLIKKIQKNAKEDILNIADEVYKLVKKYNGSISCDHNDGLARTYALNEQYDSDMLFIFKQIKSILDPNNILNPGKKITHSKYYNNKEGARAYALKNISLD